MTKMATMPIYGTFSRTNCPMILKLGIQHGKLKVYNVYINDDPGLTLTYFMARSNLVFYAFEWEKLLKSHLIGKTLQQMTNLTEQSCL